MVLYHFLITVATGIELLYTKEIFSSSLFDGAELWQNSQLQLLPCVTVLLYLHFFNLKHVQPKCLLYLRTSEIVVMSKVLVIENLCCTASS